MFAIVRVHFLESCPLLFFGFFFCGWSQLSCKLAMVAVMFLI